MLTECSSLEFARNTSSLGNNPCPGHPAPRSTRASSRHGPYVLSSVSNDVRTVSFVNVVDNGRITIVGH